MTESDPENKTGFEGPQLSPLRRGRVREETLGEADKTDGVQSEKPAEVQIPEGEKKGFGEAKRRDFQADLAEETDEDAETGPSAQQISGKTGEHLKEAPIDPTSSSTQKQLFPERHTEPASGNF